MRCIHSEFYSTDRDTTFTVVSAAKQDSHGRDLEGEVRAAALDAGRVHRAEQQGRSDRRDGPSGNELSPSHALRLPDAK